MNILTNSNEKVKRNKKYTLNILSNSNVVKQKEYNKENKNGIPVINGINDDSPKVNFFEKPKIYNVKFYYLYNQNFSKEEENIFKSFDYFTRNSKNKIKKGNLPMFHIIIGKEYLKQATQVLNIIPNDQIVLNKSNVGEDKFSNVCMIHLQYSPGLNECTNNDVPQFNEFPVFHLDFNTNKSIKRECNDDSIKNIIKLITQNGVYIDKNNSLSESGNLLSNENVNYSGVQNKEESILETTSLLLKYINNKYYKLFQKDEKNTLFIKKELLSKMFNNKSLFLKEVLFDKLKEINKNFIINDSMILSSNIHFENNNVKLIQKSMVLNGAGFLEFYKNKKNDFKSNLLKKYLMALYYIENLKHRNSLLEINSNIFNEKSIKEFQNAYYLGFDLEYILINHLKKYGQSKSLLTPFVAKYNENNNNNKYILYYLYIINKEVYLYEIMNDDERNVINKINNKVESYFKHIFKISFISKSPLNYNFKGLIRKNMEFKINFVDENKLILLYSHLHLFYKILNPKIELKEILQNKNTDEMLKFIKFLLEI